MGCGAFLVKYTLFFANLVFALAGLTLLGLGIGVQLQIKVIVDIADASFQVAPILAMVAGSIVFLIASFGCCGAIKENNCMLVTYAVFMFILMAIKLALAILIFVKLDDMVQAVPKWLNDFFAQNQNGFQEIETMFDCCGPIGPASYASTSIPNSCCATAPCTPGNSYAGCNSIVQDLFNTFGLTIGIIAIIIVAFELVAAVFGLCLASRIRSKGATY